MHALLRAVLLTTFVLIFVLVRHAVAQTPNPRLNVLLIAVDDLKPLLGCYGDKTVRTPNIDRLAKRGVLFERAYANQAVCAPSRHALLTGLRPQTLGIYDLSTRFRTVAPDAITLPQSFKLAGYRAESIGKIFHIGHGNGDDPASWSVPSTHPQGEYADPETVAVRRKATQDARATGASENEIAYKVKGPATESASVPDESYADGKTAQEAVQRLVAASKKPTEQFFLAVGFAKPHLPFCAPKKYWDMYDAARLPLAELQSPPIGAPSYAPQFGGELRNYLGMPAQGSLPPDQQRHLIHGYHAAVSFMDAQVGKVLDALDSNRLTKNTIVVLWGDHGWHLGDHGMWCKHTNYEQATRIPLLMAGPGIRTGQRAKALVETVDIYPTLCELTGVSAAPGQKLDGSSFVASLRDPATSGREFIQHVYPRGAARLGRAIRTTRYRLVEWKNPGAAATTAEMELYDYETDPQETRNLAAEKPDIVAKLRTFLNAQPEAKPQYRDNAAKATEPRRQNTTDRNALFTRRDANKDGKLTLDEFMTDQPDPEAARARFPKFDTNQDGVLTREEFVNGGKPK